MHYLIYKITNNINGKIYIGCHQTINVMDNYMGSGVHLKRAQKKYGIENFTKEILETCSSLDEMFAREAELVNEDFVRRPDTYNMKLGGRNWDTETAKRGRELTNQILREKYGEDFRKVISRMAREARSLDIHKQVAEKARKTRLERYGCEGTFTGRTHSEETKRKISAIKSGEQQGEKNSQYGTCWVYSLTSKLNKKIMKSELDDYLAGGWLKGRKLKFD